MIGTLAGDRVVMREVHRFANGPMNVLGRLYWNAGRLLEEIKTALGLCAREHIGLAGIGIDTWGVDYGLISAAGELLGLPRHYRDPRTRGGIERAAKVVARREIYASTGVQFMELNTLYQLLADRDEDPDRLEATASLLFMPNLLNFWLTGERCAEESIASTSQMFDPRARAWARPLIERLGLPVEILPTVVPSGSEVGRLTSGVAEEVGLGRIPVIAPACHDTGCAVAAAPGSGDGWAYISCGTWSLVGAELDQPICTEAAHQANFTNELGVGGTVRFLKNVPGLWLLQECQREWAARGIRCSHEELDALARGARGFSSQFDPDHPSLTGFGDMSSRIGQLAGVNASDVGLVVRGILESLALKYRVVVEDLERLTGRTVSKVHMVGGGIQNTLLCELAACALQRPVLAGPVEATALGNVLVQAMAHGHVGSRGELREIVGRSSEIRTYAPRDEARWTEAVTAFRQLTARSHTSA